MSLQNAKGIKELLSFDCMDETFSKITEDTYHSKSLTLMRKASDLSTRCCNDTILGDV
jgi:hypothetical protein